MIHQNSTSISSFLLLLFTILYLFQPIQAATYLDPYDQDSPFRNGRIYIINLELGQNFSQSTRTVQFDIAFPVVPFGVTIGVRSLSNTDNDCLQVDFSFQITGLGQTYFQVKTEMSTNYQMFWSKVIIDYISSTASGFYTYSKIPSAYQNKNNNGFNDTIIMKYEPVYSQSKTDNYRAYFVIAIVGFFQNGYFKLEATDSYLDATTLEVLVRMPAPNPTNIPKLKLTVVEYCNDDVRNIHPGFIIDGFNLQSFWQQATSQVWPNDRAEQMYWIGLQTFYGQTDRFSFSIDYVRQFYGSGYSDYYNRFDPVLEFTITIDDYFKMDFAFKAFTYYRDNCNHKPTHPYIVLKGQLCVDECPLNTTQKDPMQCEYCHDWVPQCSRCYYDLNIGVICTKCDESKGMVITAFGFCHQCAVGEYWDIPNQQCQSCTITNCNTCKLDAHECIDCDVLSQTELRSGLCVPCVYSAEIFDGSTKTCRKCDSYIPGCQECYLGLWTPVECFKCNNNSVLALSYTLCTPCVGQNYYEEMSNTCEPCGSYCEECVSGAVCTVCESVVGYDVDNVAGECVLTEIVEEEEQQEEEEPQSEEEQQEEQEQQSNNNSRFNCILAHFDQPTDTCQPSTFLSRTVQIVTYVSSIPTINLVINSFASLFSLFDDLSYYSYHKRNYSKVVSVYFGQMTNYTLLRFIPKDLIKPFQYLQFNYADTILVDNFNESQTKFHVIDGGVHLLRNTQRFWAGAVPLCIASFTFLSFIHWFSNRFIYKNQLLKRYNYFGMILVDLMGGNIQYLSFRCAEQMFQLIPLNPLYHVNLAVCYFVLFLVMVYAVGSVIIFKSFYSYLKPEYVIQELFGSYWDVRLVLTNLLKIITGFVHAYFYHDFFLQPLLLLIIWSLKTSLYTATIKKVNQQTEYLLQLLVFYLMIVFSTFLFIQTLLINSSIYTSEVENIFGGIQSVTIIISICIQIMSIAITNVKLLMEIFQNEKGEKRFSKENRNGAVNIQRTSVEMIQGEGEDFSVMDEVEEQQDENEESEYEESQHEKKEIKEEESQLEEINLGVGKKIKE